MKKSRLILIILSVLILIACIGMTGFLLFFNYKSIRLFKQAQDNFRRGDASSLDLAESQLQRVVRKDRDNEAAFIMLGEIAGKRKVFPEQVYFTHMACRLNPLNSENKEKYIRSLCFSRYFDRLENFLTQESDLSDSNKQLLCYAAGRNGNIGKYKFFDQSRANVSKYTFPDWSKENNIGALASLLYKEKKMGNAEKLARLGKMKDTADEFLKQEILAAETEIHVSAQDYDRAEKSLYEAYKLNEYAFALPLGTFYAHYRSLSKALAVLEKHLATYHDPLAALQAAELYCLLKRTSEIQKIRKLYQGDTGKRAMLFCYYFDALAAYAENDMAKMKDLLIPLRKSITTPLAAYMFFCADAQGDDLTRIYESYTKVIGSEHYLNLQEQADNILSGVLKKAFANKNVQQEKLLDLATLLHKRKPEVFTAKIILLAQKRSNPAAAVLLKDALKRFGDDPGIVKIGIEYYLKNEPPRAEELIGSFKKKFPQKAADMLRYEIFVNGRKGNFDKVSELFRKNFSPKILPEYWSFASRTMRESDLLFLSKEPLYGPFAQALLLLKKGENKKACALLEKADHRNNLALLFLAARILAEKGFNQAALKKYALFPEKSPYEIPVLLNMAELHAEKGSIDQALLLSGRAYNLAPQMAETQLCYADKLHRHGNLKMIPDVIRLAQGKSYRSRMVPLWAAGMEQRIKDCDFETQKEKIRELCRQLKAVVPDNKIALEYWKKLQVWEMEQKIQDCDLKTQKEKIRELCRQLLALAPDNNIALEYLKKIQIMPQ